MDLHWTPTGLVSTAVKERREKVAWLERVATEPGEGCRPWPWAVNNKGYGMVRWAGTTRKVTHVILELAGQPRPDGQHALHSCDQPLCAAPWHLRWGTNGQNVADAIARGRRAVS